MSDTSKPLAPLQIDVVSDVVCPWCFIGKRRLEKALALIPNIPVEVQFHPYFLNPWVPREGMARDEYLTTKFGSPERYKGIAGRVAEAAAAEGLTYAVDKMRRQPNTLDCHRLILWAESTGHAAADEAAADGPLFHRRGRPLRSRGAGAGGDRGRPRSGNDPRHAGERRRRGAGRKRRQRRQGCRHRRRADLHPEVALPPSAARNRRKCWPTRSSRSRPIATASWPSNGRRARRDP